MGIRGLTGWIRWAALSTIQEPDWEKWKGKTIGIDILGFLYNAKARQQCPFLYTANLIVACREYNIHPVPIFDGKPPEEKRGALLQRSKLRHESEAKREHLNKDIQTVEMTVAQREVLETEVKKLEKRTLYLTSDERDQVKQLFYACGIVSLNATGEADSVLAYFSKRGVFDAVMSNDLDLLSRGVETLIVPENYALPGDVAGWTQYSLSSITRAVGFNYVQFVEMCVLMGSDYTVGQPSLPYKSAFWAIKYRGSIQLSLLKLGVADMSAYVRAIGILRGDDETQETLMGEKQWEKMSGSQPRCEPETLMTLRKTYLESMPEEKFTRLTRLTTQPGAHVKEVEQMFASPSKMSQLSE